MKKFAALLLLFGLPELLVAQEKSQPPKPLVFTHVTVIDATGAPPQPDMTVVITGDRITALGKTGTVRIPQGALVVDATSKFLIPGLWDMHVHVWDRAFFPLFVANGVTGVRNVGIARTYQVRFEQWREEIASGALLGPRLVASGLTVDGVATEAEARQAVRSLKKQGADFIKVWSVIPRTAYFALADEAQKQSLPLVGHVPFAVTPAEASAAGQKTIEHLTGVLLACSTREDELRKTVIEATAKPPLSDPDLVRFLFFFPPPKDVFPTYSKKKAAELFSRFVRNGTWQVPTFTLWRSYAFIEESRLANEGRLKYIPASLREEFDPSPSSSANLVKEFTEEDVANAKLLFRKHLELAKVMHQHGVEFLTGTDAAAPYVIPGFSLHDELDILVQAGFNPMEALQAATRNSAKFLGRLDSLGTVETGKIADLVLLDANPLEDIRHAQKILAVVLDGRYFDRAALDKLLADVEAAAQKQ